jgi:small conductance mechanosensitive channel
MSELLLDQPQLMAWRAWRSTPSTCAWCPHPAGKQFEVGRQLRLLVIAALGRAGIVSKAENTSLAANVQARSE